MIHVLLSVLEGSTVFLWFRVSPNVTWLGEKKRKQGIVRVQGWLTDQQSAYVRAVKALILIGSCYFERSSFWSCEVCGILRYDVVRELNCICTNHVHMLFPSFYGFDWVTNGSQLQNRRFEVPTNSVSHSWWLELRETNSKRTQDWWWKCTPLPHERCVFRSCSTSRISTFISRITFSLENGREQDACKEANYQTGYSTEKIQCSTTMANKICCSEPCDVVRLQERRGRKARPHRRGAYLCHGYKCHREVRVQKEEFLFQFNGRR